MPLLVHGKKNFKKTIFRSYRCFPDGSTITNCLDVLLCEEKMDSFIEKILNPAFPVNDNEIKKKKKKKNSY